MAGEQWWARAALVIGAVLVMASCGGSGSDAAGGGGSVAETTSTSTSTSTTTTNTTTTSTTAPLPVIDPRNATYPANSCSGQGGYGWESSAITVVDGTGESVGPDGGFGGATLQDVAEIGRVDVDGDGAEEIVVTGTCFGSTVAMCCAGRTSMLLVVLVLRGGRPAVELLGSPNFGRPGEPTRHIEEVRLDGADIVTIQPLVYPESDSGTTEEIRYGFAGGEWVEVGATEPESSAGPSTEVEEVTIDACRDGETPPISEEGGIRRASICTYLSWQSGDRELAARYADPAAVDVLFDSSNPVEPWTFKRCDPGSGPWKTTCVFETSQAVGVIFHATAYDDVVVVSSIEYALE